MAYYIIIRMEDYYIDEQEYLDDPIEKHSPELTKESTMGSDYPTFETLTREINLLQLADEYQEKQIPNPILNEIKITKTQNQSLLDLEFNIHDSHNTNLLDIISNDDHLQYIKFLDGREIQIDNQMETISEGYITSYKLYTIRSKTKSGKNSTEVKRRFSDFQFLQQQLFENYPGHIIPILPEKNFWASLNMEGKDYSEARIKGLKKYIESLLINQKLRVSPHLRLFLFDSSQEFAEIKGEFQQKLKIQDKVKTVAGRVFTMGKEFISSIASFKSGNTAKSSWFQLISKDNVQVTQLCLKLKGLFEVTTKIEPILVASIKVHKIFPELENIFHVENPKIQKLRMQLIESFQDCRYYIESCWQAVQRHGGLHCQVQELRSAEESLVRKHQNNPRAKEMDLVRNRMRKVSERQQRSSLVLQEQMKGGVVRGEYLVRNLLELYFNFRREECN